MLRSKEVYNSKNEKEIQNEKIPELLENKEN